MELTDPLRQATRALLGLREGDPTQLWRHGLYRARVDACASDGSTVDVTPEDARLQPMAAVPLRVGIPGAVAVMQGGAVVLIGWERGDPAKAYAVPAWEPGATVTKLVLSGATVYLGAEAGAEFVALANLVADNLGALKDAIADDWTPVQNDGGAALKTVLTALFVTGWPTSTAATKVKAV